MSVNRNKVDQNKVVGSEDCVGSGIVLIQRGKKNHYLVRVTG